MSNRVETIVKWLVWVLLASGAATIAYLSFQADPNCAIEAAVGDARKLALAEHTDIVKWGLGLSVTMVGLFGSFMLRLKESPNLTRTGHLLFFSAMSCFAFAAYFALLWRSRLGLALYMECSSLAAHPWMTNVYDAHHWFFVGGLAVLLATACLIAFGGEKR